MFRRTAFRVLAILAAGGAALGLGAVNAAAAAMDDAGNSDGAAVSVSLPVTVCGNSVGLLGGATSTCTPPPPSSAAVIVNPAASSGGGASGGAIAASVDAPITVCGNAISVLRGSARATCSPSSPESGQTNPSSGGTGGLLSGQAVAASVSSPVTACGNAISAVGSASASCWTTKPTQPASPGAAGSGDTSEPTASGGSSGPVQLPPVSSGPPQARPLLGTSGGEGVSITAPSAGSFQPLGTLAVTGGGLSVAALIGLGLTTSGRVINARSRVLRSR
jgi:hypothetical protein